MSLPARAGDVFAIGYTVIAVLYMARLMLRTHRDIAVLEAENPGYARSMEPIRITLTLASVLFGIIWPLSVLVEFVFLADEGPPRG